MKAKQKEKKKNFILRYPNIDDHAYTAYIEGFGNGRCVASCTPSLVLRQPQGKKREKAIV